MLIAPYLVPVVCCVCIVILRLAHLDAEKVYLSPGEGVVFVEGVSASCTVFLGTVSYHVLPTLLLMMNVSSNECELVNPESVFVKLCHAASLGVPMVTIRVKEWIQAQCRDAV
jgi:hypothetical protein